MKSPLSPQAALEELLGFFKDLPPPTKEEIEQQIISFAYGNVKLHNPNVTKEMVEEEYRKLRNEQKSI